MTTDHRAEAERWLGYIDTERDDSRAQVQALAAIAHALLALGDVIRPVGFTFVIPDPPSAEAERTRRIADDIADEYDR